MEIVAEVSAVANDEDLLEMLYEQMAHDLPPFICDFGKIDPPKKKVFKQSWYGMSFELIGVNEPEEYMPVDAHRDNDIPWETRMEEYATLLEENGCVYVYFRSPSDCPDGYGITLTTTEDGGYLSNDWYDGISAKEFSEQVKEAYASNPEVLDASDNCNKLSNSVCKNSEDTNPVQEGYYLTDNDYELLGIERTEPNKQEKKQEVKKSSEDRWTEGSEEYERNKKEIMGDVQKSIKEIRKKFAGNSRFDSFESLQKAYPECSNTGLDWNEITVFFNFFTGKEVEDYLKEIGIIKSKDSAVNEKIELYSPEEIDFLKPERIKTNQCAQTVRKMVSTSKSEADILQELKDEYKKGNRPASFTALQKEKTEINWSGLTSYIKRKYNMTPAAWLKSEGIIGTGKNKETDNHCLRNTNIRNQQNMQLTFEEDDESRQNAYWDSIEIDIRVTEKDTAKKIEKIDFTNVGLKSSLRRIGEVSSNNKEIENYGLFETDVDAFIDDAEDETVGPFAAMRLIQDVLGMDGTAVIICKSVNSNNEVNECIVYYYLGDEIRTRDFLDVDTRYYYYNDFLEVLLDLSDEEIETTYEEMFEETEGESREFTGKSEIYRSINHSRNHLAYEIAAALGNPDLEYDKEIITEVYNGSEVSALFDAIDEKRRSCVLDYDDLSNNDFTPTLKWEDKEITTFTKLEKYMMNKYYKTYQPQKNGVRIYKFPWQYEKNSGEVELEISEWEYRRIRCAYWHGFNFPDEDDDLKDVGKRVREHLDLYEPESEQKIDVGYPKRIAEELENHALDNTYEYLVVRDGYIQITECWVKNKEVTLPEKVDGYIVESIGDYAIFPRSMENLIIPGNVKQINCEAVSEYDNLKSVVIREGVEDIKTFAFKDCKNLHEITLPKSIVHLGCCIFFGCDFRAVTTYLSKDIMQSDGWSQSVRSTILRVSYTSDKKVIVCGQLESIEEAMFSGMWDLKCLVLPEGVKTIGVKAFLGCSALTEINLPDSVSAIAAMAFAGCKSLTTLSLPKSISEIAPDAFVGCDKLTIIADEGTYVKGYAIQHGIRTESEKLDKKQQVISSHDSEYSEHVIQNLKTKYSKEAPPPSFVTMKSENEEIEWSKIERYIKKAYGSTPSAWFRENGIVKDAVGTDVHNYMNEDFSRFIEKKGYDTESDVIHFLHYMEGVSDKYMDQPAASYEEIIKENKSNDLSGFESVCRKYYQMSPAAVLSELGIISKGKRELTTAVLSQRKSANDFKILRPYRNAEIGSWEYSHYSWEKLIEIPEGVIEIKSAAFKGAEITCVKLPGSLKKIGDQAFAECKYLSKVEIQEGLEEIKHEAFAFCPELNDIILPSTIKSVDYNAFRIDNNSLESKVTVHLTGNCARHLLDTQKESWKSIQAKEFIVDGIAYPTLEKYYVDYQRNRQDIPEERTYVEMKEQRLDLSGRSVIEEDEFLGKSFNGIVVIPEGIREIKNSAFQFATQLGVRLPTSLRKLGEGAFYFCKYLRFAEIPYGIEEIGMVAFGGDNLMTEVRLPDSIKVLNKLAFAEIATGNFDEKSHLTVYMSAKTARNVQLIFELDVPGYDRIKTVAKKFIIEGKKYNLNSRVYFVTTLNPPAVMGWYLRQSIYPFAG